MGNTEFVITVCKVFLNSKSWFSFSKNVSLTVGVNCNLADFLYLAFELLVQHYDLQIQETVKMTFVQEQLQLISPFGF